MQCGEGMDANAKRRAQGRPLFGLAVAAPTSHLLAHCILPAWQTRPGLALASNE